MPAARVVCIGDAMFDVLAVLPGPLAIGSDTPAPISFAHGGSAANTAAWLAATGTPAAFVGRVGDDALGREFLDTLRAGGVQVEVGIDAHNRTGVCLVLVGPDGERTMIPSAGANATLSTADVAAVALRGTDRLHVSGYALFNPGSRAAARQALDRGLSSGTPISVDVASADPLVKVGAATFLNWLPESILLLANLDEASVLAGVDEPLQAARTLSQRFAAVVVKCGARGAVVALGSDVIEVAASPVRVLDSTGAGDAFAAGLLGALFDGEPLATAARRGNEFGSRAVSVLGARPPANPA